MNSEAKPSDNCLFHPYDKPRLICCKGFPLLADFSELIVFEFLLLGSDHVLFALMATSSISDVKALKETQIGPTNVTENERLHDSLWLSEKWQGTAADQHDMATLGRVQELRVRLHDTSEALYANVTPNVVKA